MEHQAVKSSRLREVAYDQEKQELWVLYRNGQRYRFKEVPQSFYLEMLMADSIGGYFFDNIRYSFPNQLIPAETKE